MREINRDENGGRSVSSLDDLDASDFEGIVTDGDGSPRFTVEVVDNLGAGPHEE